MFTSPVTVNNGTVDVTYTFVTQDVTSASFIGNYSNYGAAVDQESKVIVKQKKGNSAKTNALVKVTDKFTVTSPTTGLDTLKMSDWNLTYAGSTAIPEADVQAQLNVLLALAGQANFVRNLRGGAV
jgi:hypothetical protein